MAEAPKSFNDALGTGRALLAGLTVRQRALLMGGIAVLGVTVWIFYGLLAKPKFVTLYSGLRASEAQDLASRLAAKNISYQLAPDSSSILVPEEQLDTARLQTASQGLPRNARLGFELFDSPNWAGSDFTEKVNYQRALEGELERTLQTMNEVEAVRVHLVLPKESLYTEQESPAKAAVILKTRGARLSEQAQLAIPQLIASAVEGLRPENVTVVDADTNTPLLHPTGLVDGRAAYELDEGLSKTLLHTLEPVVGEGHVSASVHVEYDLSTSENTDEIYDPKTAATLTSQKSEETMGGAAPAGVPGTASNLPGGASTNVTVAAENQSSRSESSTFAVSKTTRHTTLPAGRIRRIAAAVVVDDAVDMTDQSGKKVAVRRKRTADEMKQISQLASAALGLDTQRGDLLSIENLSFQQAPVEALAPVTKIEHWRHLIEPWVGSLRYVAIVLLFLIVYFLILRPVKKQILSTFREIPQHLAKGSAKLAAHEEKLPVLEPELSDSEEGRRANALKKQLTEKVKQEPAAATRLVQGWIRETK